MNAGNRKIITGGLSKPSKMPGYAYNLPATECKVGSKLVKIPGSVCHGCYALKGRYRFKNVQDALNRRLKALEDPRWVEAMVELVTGEKHFRWHDSGDIQSPDHLEKIVQIAKRTPHIKHWLPTKESGDIKNYKGKIPKNLVVRLSGTFVDGKPPTYTHTSIATSDVDRVTCLASLPKDHPKTQEGCQDCRQCWDSNVKNIAYYNH